MSPGTRDVEAQAAPVAASVKLERMRRRVRMSRMALFAAIAAGPVALCVAVLPRPSAASTAPAAAATAVRTTAAAADPAGYAQLFLGAWLRSSDDEASAQARFAQSLAPDIDLPQPAAGAQSAPVSLTAVRSEQRASGTWVVTVAVQYADGVRYFAVPVAADRAGASFTVTASPAVVAGPARGATASSVYSVAVPSDGGVASAVGEFLGAYLAGAGEVDRYLAPGVQMRAVSPAPFASVTVQEVLGAQDVAAGAKVPADGTSVQVYAGVEARDASGRWPLAYEISFRARSGRWEVTALESGPGEGHTS